MGRLGVLDGLRAIAILIVMASHAQLGHIVPGGFGVTIFFFLSGYLITTLLRIEFEMNGFVSFRAFYLRRSVRIIPPLFFCYVATAALMGFGLLERPINPQGIWVDILFLTNYAPPLPSSGVPILLWSLAVEEHFYLLFPIPFVALLILDHRIRILGILALILAALGLRFFEFARGNEEFISSWTHTRFDAILFGVLLTLDQASEKIWARATYVLFLGLATLLITFLVRDEYFRATIRYTLQGVGLFFVFKVLLEGNLGWVQSALRSYVMRRIADWSYVLYLIHLPIVMVVGQQIVGIHPLAKFVTGVGLAFVFAMALERYVEKPSLAWRKRVQGSFQPPPLLTPKGIE